MCFADRAFKILIDGDEEELLHQGMQPDDTITVECKTFCPRTPSIRQHIRRSQRAILDDDELPDSVQSATASLDDNNELSAVPSTGPSPRIHDNDAISGPNAPSSSHAVPSQAFSLLSPILSPSLGLNPLSVPQAANTQIRSSRAIIDLTLPSPHRSLVDPPSTANAMETDQRLGSAVAQHNPIYIPPTPPTYDTLEAVDDAIMGAFQDDVEHSPGMVHVRGPTVKACAVGLIDFLIQHHINPNLPYARSPHVDDRFLILPRDLKLADMFGQHWIFRA